MNYVQIIKFAFCLDFSPECVPVRQSALLLTPSKDCHCFTPGPHSWAPPHLWFLTFSLASCCSSTYSLPVLDAGESVGHVAFVLLLSIQGLVNRVFPTL